MNQAMLSAGWIWSRIRSRSGSYCRNTRSWDGSRSGNWSGNWGRSWSWCGSRFY